MTEPVVETPETPEGWPPWVEQWVLPFVRESGLWPVLVALLGHVVVIIAPLMLTWWRGNLGASLPLTVMLLGSYWLCSTDYKANGRRPGAVSAVVLGCWGLSAVVAYAAGVTGVL